MHVYSQTGGTQRQKNSSQVVVYEIYHVGSVVLQINSMCMQVGLVLFGLVNVRVS